MALLVPHPILGQEAHVAGDGGMHGLTPLTNAAMDPRQGG